MSGLTRSEMRRRFVDDAASAVATLGPLFFAGLLLKDERAADLAWPYVTGALTVSFAWLLRRGRFST